MRCRSAGVPLAGTLVAVGESVTGFYANRFLSKNGFGSAAWTGTRNNTVEKAWVTRMTDSSDLQQVQFLPEPF